MQTVKVTTSQNIDIDYEVASVGDRILAYLIDLAVFFGVYLLFLMTGLLFGSSNSNSFAIGYGIGVLLIIWIVLFVFYDIICEVCFNGQSIGKKAMKTRVISLDGTSPTFGQYLLRWIFRIVDFTITGVGGLISVIVTNNNQRIGDIVGGTTVIKTRARTRMEHIAYTPPEENYQPVFSQALQLNDDTVDLIHEVLNNYATSQNNVLVHNLALKLKEQLGLKVAPEMDDLQLVQTLLKDYNHLSAQLTP